MQQVGSTAEALVALSHGRFDLLLSDMERDRVPDAGLRMLAQLGRSPTPVVFYVGWVDEARGVPPRAFGMADRPEPLLHLALDVLERCRA